MKTNFLRKLPAVLISAAFLSCISCNSEDGPEVHADKELDVSVSTLKFTYEESSEEVSVTSNTDWKVDFGDQAVYWDWIEFSPESGTGNGKILVKVSKNEGESGRSANLRVSCEGISKTITIEQGVYTPEPPIEKVILFENVGEEAANSEVGDFSGWLKSGTGASGVSYSGSNAQVRNTMGSSSYENASGGNNIFFYTYPQEFIIKDIDISGETSFTFSFGISDAVSSSSYSPVTSSTIKLAASLDGMSYTSLEYTNLSESSWVVASSEFVVPEGSQTLFIKLYEAYSSGVVRADDFKLIAGGNGTTLIEPSPEVQWGTPSSNLELIYEDVNIPVTLTVPYTDGVGQTVRFDVSDRNGGVFGEDRQLIFGNGNVVLTFDYTPSGIGANAMEIEVDGVSIGSVSYSVYGIVYYENFNATTDHTYNPGSTQSYRVEDYTDYLKQNQPGVTYEGVKISTSDLSMVTWVSSVLSKSLAGVEQYEGASGSYHVLLGGATNNFHQFVIKGLDTSAAQSENMTMKLGVSSMVLSNPLTVSHIKMEYSLDNGVVWNELSFSGPANPLGGMNTWREVTITSEIPSTDNLAVRFTPITATALRIDDIRIVGY